MRHDFVDRFARVPSPVAGIDPRTRLVAALTVLLTVVGAPASRPGMLAVCAGFIAGYAALARVPAGWLVARSAVALPFALLAGAWLPFARPGVGGWAALAVLAARTFLAAAVIVLLAATTRFPHLLRGMEGLGLPRVMSLVLSFTYRFLFVLVEEAERLEMAVRSRAPMRRRRFRALTGAAGYLFLRTYERAERVYQAMLARGFHGEIPVGEIPRWGVQDALAVAVTAGFLWVAWRIW